MEKQFDRNEIIYSISVQDVQDVATQEFSRMLSVEEIEQVIKAIERKINWFEIIADSISENVKNIT